MKKQTIYSLAVVLLLFGFGQIAFGQISVGVRAGLSLNNFKVDPLEDGEPEPEMKVGFQVAVPIEIALGSMFAIQPELIYATHGAKQEGSNTQIEGGFTSVSSIKSDATINTLEIPVLGKLKFGSESTKLYVLAGPSFGFGLSGEYDFEGTLKTTDPLGTVIFDESSDGILDAKFVKDGYDASEVEIDEFAVSKTNLNLHMGAGLSFSLGGASLFFDARYMLGLSDLSPEAQGTAKEDEVEIKSNRIGLSVGVMFPLN